MAIELHFKCGKFFLKGTYVFVRPFYVAKPRSFKRKSIDQVKCSGKIGMIE